MEYLIGAVIAFVVTLLIAIPVTRKVSIDKYKRDEEAKIGNAEDKARTIIDEALKTAEEKKRESMIEVKEESDIDSFLGGGQMSFLADEIKGLDDFELICFLVVR